MVDFLQKHLCNKFKKLACKFSFELKIICPS